MLNQARLADLLSRAEWQIARKIERALEPSGLSIEQWRVLSHLSDGAGHPMSEIARQTLMPPPTLTKLVDRLVDRSLVYRRADPADRRRVLVCLSDRGRAQHSELDAIVREEENRIAAHLGADDADRFLVLLDLVLDRLDNAPHTTRAPEPDTPDRDTPDRAAAAG